MSIPQDNQSQNTETQKKDDKEFNFVQLRQQLERERAEKQALLERAEKAEKVAQDRFSHLNDDDDTSDDPYIDEKRLNKKLTKFSQQTNKDTDDRINKAVQGALAEERRRTWLKNNSDFSDVMQHAQTFAEKNPELAETILEMPEGFERQKLVYKNIKVLGLHKKPDPEPSIQEKIDSNRRGAFYQPTGVGSAPYGQPGAGGKNYSPAEMKTAYDRVQELKSTLRI